MPEPIRTCVATRQRHPRSVLLRLVADPDGRVRVDLDGRAPGRGAWILPQAELLARVQARPRMLNHALKRKGLSAEGLVDQARREVLDRLLDQLVACHRAGVAVTGRQAVAAATDLVAVLYARGARPLAHPADVHVIELALGPVQLGALLGRGPRSIVGLRPSKPTRRLLRWLRWALSLGYPPV